MPDSPPGGPHFTEGDCLCMQLSYGDQTSHLNREVVSLRGGLIRQARGQASSGMKITV